MCAHKCSSCGEPTNMQVWTKDVSSTDRGDEVREGWEWLCGDCYLEMIPECEREGDERTYTPYEETAKYREEMIDAGRGHLLK